MTPSKKIELLRNMKTNELFNLCLAAYMNATDLFDTAGVVYGDHRYNISYFLALTASEEFAKAVVISQYALLKRSGKLTEKLEELHLQLIYKSLRFHEIKYEFLDHLLIIEPPSDFTDKGSSDKTGFLSSDQIESLSPDQIEKLSDKVEDMLIAINEPFLHLLNGKQLKGPTHKQLAKRWEALKKRRNDTLYIDIWSNEDKIEVKTPLEITRLNALEMMQFTSEIIDETSGWFDVIQKLLEINSNKQ